MPKCVLEDSFTFSTMKVLVEICILKKTLHITFITLQTLMMMICNDLMCT